MDQERRSESGGSVSSRDHSPCDRSLLGDREEAQDVHVAQQESGGQGQEIRPMTSTVRASGKEDVGKVAMSASTVRASGKEDVGNVALSKVTTVRASGKEDVGNVAMPQALTVHAQRWESGKVTWPYGPTVRASECEEVGKVEMSMVPTVRASEYEEVGKVEIPKVTTVRASTSEEVGNVAMPNAPTVRASTSEEVGNVAMPSAHTVHAQRRESGKVMMLYVNSVHTSIEESGIENTQAPTTVPPSARAMGNVDWMSQDQSQMSQSQSQYAVPPQSYMTGAMGNAFGSAPNTVPISSPYATENRGNVYGWSNGQPPRMSRPQVSPGNPVAQSNWGPAEMYGDSSSSSEHLSPHTPHMVHPHYQQMGEMQIPHTNGSHPDDMNWDNNPGNTCHMFKQNDLEGGEMYSPQEETNVPHGFALQFGDCNSQFEHPNVTKRRGRGPLVNITMDSDTSVNEDERRESEIRKREETMRSFTEMVNTPFQMTPPAPSTTVLPTTPSAVLAQKTIGLSIHGEQHMDTEVRLEKYRRARREFEIDDRQRDGRLVELTAQRDQLHREWSRLREENTVMRDQLDEIMRCLNVTSDPNEVIREITHLQDEKARYQAMSESMMDEMKKMRERMEAQMAEQLESQRLQYLGEIQREQSHYRMRTEPTVTRVEQGTYPVWNENYHSQESNRLPQRQQQSLPHPQQSRPLQFSSRQPNLDQRESLSPPPASEKSFSLRSERMDGNGSEMGDNNVTREQHNNQQNTQSTVDPMFLLVSQMTGALTQIKPFEPKYEKFDEFMERFNLKHRGQSDRDKMITLPSLLGDSESIPAKVFRSLPEELRKGSDLSRVIAEMKRALDKNAELSPQKAQQKLDELSGKGEVIYICREIESLVGRGMKYMEGNVKDRFMKDTFLKVMRQRPEYDKIIDEYYREGSTFMDLRTTAQRAEFIEATKKKDREKEKDKPASSKTEANCYNCGKKGHQQKDCRSPKRLTQQPSSNGFKSTSNYNQYKKPSDNETTSRPNNGYKYSTQNSTNTFGGNKYGGNSNSYSSGNRPFNRTGNTASGTGGNLTRQSTHSNDARANEVQISKDEPSSMKSKDGIQAKDLKGETEGVTFVGSRLHTEMKVEGVTKRVLVDSGAQVSLIPKRILQPILASKGVQWNEFLDTRVQMPETNLRIMGASKTVMKLCGKAILQVQVNGETDQNEIGFYITDCDQDEILLGVNAFKTLNVRITLGTDPMERREEKEDTEMTNVARVAKSLWLHPGQVSPLTVSGPQSSECILWSQRKEIDSGMCTLDEHGQTEIPVINTSDVTHKFTKGEVIGVWNGEMVTENDNGLIEGRVEYVSMSSEERTRDQRISEILKHLKEEKGDELSPGMRDLVSEFEDMFALDDNELGKSTVVEHSIDTGDSKPIKQRARPVPYTLREPLQKLLNTMEDTGIIRPSTSPWASPVVLVKKKDGSIRLCIDYRKLNEVIKTDAYPLPRINDCVQELRGKRLFSTLDLKSGFWQIGLEESSIEKTAFSTLDAHYEFVKLPFGLCTSPAVFQRTMNIILQSELQKPMGERDVFCYIDDILIATADEKSHLAAMERVLTLLREGNMRLNVKKCLLEKDQVHYLGHTIDGSGVSIQKEKVKAMKEFPRPPNKEKLRQFLGMTGFNRKFIRNFAALANPLFALTSTKRAWSWGDPEEQSFNLLKEKMCTAPVLAQPNHEAAVSGEAPFIITTDACGEGIGAVLSQKGSDGNERPIQYFSRTLLTAERNYGITDLEGLAVYEGVSKFRHYIIGTRCIVRTDHQPLVSMFRRLNLSPRVMRWAQLLQEHNIQMEYIQGAVNSFADALSRNPIESETKTSDGAPWESIVNAVSTRSMKNQSWEKAYANDEWCNEILKTWKEMSLEERSEKNLTVPDSRKRINFNDLRVDGGMILIQDEKHRWKVYVPEEKREEVMRDEHEGLSGGHFGSMKLIPKMETRYYWGSLRRDVPKYCRACKTCAIVNPKQILTPPLTPFTPTRPLEIVGIDLCDMGRSIKGNRFILTVIDHFTKFTSAYPLRDKTAEAVARTLVEEWMLREGRAMEQLLSDQGREFDNAIMRTVSELLGIEQIFTLGYDSRRNGVTERMHRTITTVIRKMVMDGKSKGSWDDLLPFAVYAYNSTPHTTTKFSPYFLMNGREPRHISKVYPKSLYCLSDDYGEILKEGLRDIYDEVQSEIQKQGEKMKLAFDKGAVSRDSLPGVGELVYMRVPTEKRGRKNPKLINEWKGPFLIKEVGLSSAKIVSTSNPKDEKQVQYQFLKRVPKEVANPEVDTMRDRREIRCSSVQISMDTDYRIVLGHPLHLDFICKSCKGASAMSVRQRVLLARTRQTQAAHGFAGLVQKAQYGLIPLTEKEIIEGYQGLCAHRAISLSEATEDIVYEGESSQTPESMLAGSIIRMIVQEATQRLKRDIVLGPKEIFPTASLYVVDLGKGATLTEQLTDAKTLIPSRMMVLIPRKIDETEWALATSILHYLSCRGWELFIVQSPPTLATSQARYDLTDERLSTLREEIAVWGTDMAERTTIATHTDHLHKGFWPMSLAAAHDHHALFEWFGAAPREEEEEGEEEETEETVQKKHSHSHPHHHSAHHNSSHSKPRNYKKNRPEFASQGKPAHYNKIPQSNPHNIPITGGRVIKRDKYNGNGGRATGRSINNYNSRHY